MPATGLAQADISHNILFPVQCTLNSVQYIVRVRINMRFPAIYRKYVKYGMFKYMFKFQYIGPHRPEKGSR